MKKAEIDQGNLSTSDESENDEREETMGMRHNRCQEHYVDSGHCHVTPQTNQVHHALITLRTGINCFVALLEVHII